MIKLKNILSEEVYGNKATVYHRTESSELLSIILNNNFKHNSGMYGEGMYTTYEPTDKTDWEEPNPKTGDLENDNPEGRLNYKNYGPFQVKFSVDLINFFIFDWDVYKTVKPHIAKIEKFTKQKSDINNFINLQAEYFKINHRINTEYQKRYTSELALEFGFDYSYKFTKNIKLNGIIFFGSRDGNVLVCYNKDMLVPISMTIDDSNKKINLQKMLNSDMKLKDKFKSYFKKFIQTKNVSMSNATLNSLDIAKKTWKYDMNANMYSCDGDVRVTEDFIRNGKLLIKFDIVKGDFNCSNTSLTSLEGCPKEVGGNFSCYYTKITSLEGAPNEVGKSFICHNTNITSLEGCPEKIYSDFSCHHTNITSLEGCPKEVGGNFSCYYTKITSLEGCPKKVTGFFMCHNTNITSLEGCPEKIYSDFTCYHTNITSLKGAPLKVKGAFDCSNTNITSLEGCPELVAGSFDCSDTNITSLEGCPKKVKYEFRCSNTQITSLKGAPIKIVDGVFVGRNCTKLESLDYLPKAKYYDVPYHLEYELRLILKERGEIK